MPEPLGSLLESSLRGLALVAFAAAAVGIGRLSVAGRHRTWTSAVCVFLVLPLAGASQLEILVPDRGAEPGAASRAAEAPGTGSADPGGEAVWQSVRYRPASHPWHTALVALWAAGVALSFGHLLLGLGGLHRLRRGAVLPPPELADRLCPLHTTRLEGRISARVSGPVLLGVRRGLLLLPVESVRWDDATLRSVIAHELCHWRNRDPLRLLVARIAICALWFHPGGWWLRSRLARSSEERADDAGAEAVGRRLYARCLASIALESASARSGGARPALAMAAPGTVGRRLRRLLRPDPASEKSRAPLRLALAGILGLSAAAAAVPVAPVLPAPDGFHREVARLESSRAEERAEALFRLGRWAGQERRAIPHLLAALGDDAPIRAMPRWSYVEEGWAPARGVWWRASPGEVAALSLASMSRRAAPVLEAALASPEPVARRNAAWALGELRHPRGLSPAAIDGLVEALRDPSPEVRAAAAWSLGDIGAAQSLPAVRERLRSEADRSVLTELEAAESALRRGVSLEAFRRRMDRNGSTTD